MSNQQKMTNNKNMNNVNIFDDYLLTNNKQTKSIPNYYEREKSKSAKDLYNTTIQIRKKYVPKERPKSFHEDYKEYEQFNQYFNFKNHSSHNNKKYSKDETKRYSTIRANNQRNYYSNNEKSKKEQNSNKNQQILVKQQPVVSFSNLPIYHSDYNKTSQNNRQLLNEYQPVNQQYSNFYPHQLSYRMAYPSDAAQFYNIGFIPTAVRLPGIHQNQIFYAPPGIQVQKTQPIQPRQSKAIPIINPQVNCLKK